VSQSLPGITRRVLDPVTAALEALQRQVGEIVTATTRRGNSTTLTGQSASIAATNFLTAARNGIYRATVIVQDTTADALSAATVLATIGWTSRAGARTSATTALPVNVLGEQQKTIEMQVEPNTHITYATTVTGAILTARYAIEVRLERIG
jgi:TRAP-type C4-dicarboxylate transport system permease small subunit